MLAIHANRRARIRDPDDGSGGGGASIRCSTIAAPRGQSAAVAACPSRIAGQGAFVRTKDGAAFIRIIGGAAFIRTIGGAAFIYTRSIADAAPVMRTSGAARGSRGQAPSVVGR